MDRLRFLILASIVATLFIGTAPVQASYAEYPPPLPKLVVREVAVEVVREVVSERPVFFRSFGAELKYLPVPPENLNPIDYVIPDFIWAWQSKHILQWLPLVEQHTELDPILILALIAQESRGDNNVECTVYDWNEETNSCNVIGLMQLSVHSWTGTRSQLQNPSYNISVGTHLLEVIIGQAIEKGYKPGREATRVALAAYNCGWTSLEANKCYSFGGWAYADKVLNYWYPLLQQTIVKGEQE